MYLNEIPMAKVRSIRAGHLTPEESSRLKQKGENFRWLRKNHENLEKSYLNQYVAAKNESIIGSDADLDKLLPKLRKDYGENFCTIAIEYISSEEDKFYREY